MAINGWKPTWLLKRQAGALLARAERDPSPENLSALEEWRRADPRQAAALGAGAKILLDYARPLAPPATAAEARPDRPAGLHGPWRRAASLILALLLASIFIIFLRAMARSPIEAVLLSTNVGEIRDVPLSDGSKVTLDTATVVRVEIGASGRLARLERGRARFAVAPKSVPFTIISGKTSVRLVEGIVDLSWLQGEPAIALIRGRADVGPGAGSEARGIAIHAPVAIDGAGREVALDPDSKSDWTSGRLSFEETSLADAVAAANRYGKAKIIVRDPSVAKLKVTGVFRSGDLEGLAKSLAAAFELKLEQDPQGNWLLTRP